MSTNAPARTNGSTWYVQLAREPRAGSPRRGPARRVTIAQNAVSASDAAVVDAPRSLVMSSCAQLPLTVSQMPYRTANPA